jgi:hypothetical protein
VTVRRRKRVGIALSGLYLLLLVGAALFYLLDPDMGTEDKVFATTGVAAIPAVAFVGAAAPLLRGSQNRLVLRSGAAFAVIAAGFQLMLTFGVALPLSVVLLGAAVADTNRAARLGRSTQSDDSCDGGRTAG